MTKRELEQWQAVTDSSQYRWVEDRITRLNGRGTLYYTGGGDGCFMRITPEGNLTIGIYEGAIPHIGEACFQVKAERKCSSYDEAFQKACELGGIKFLMDLFSSGQVPQEPTQGMHL